MEIGVALLMLCVAALQSALGNLFEQPAVRLDLVLMTGLFFSFSKGWRQGLFFGAMAGFCKDIYSIQPLGFNMIVGGLSCGIGGVMHEFFLESMLLNMILVGLVSFAGGLVNLFLHDAAMPVSSGAILRALAMSALINSLVSFLVFGLFKRVRHALHKNLLFFHS